MLGAKTNTTTTTTTTTKANHRSPRTNEPTARGEPGSATARRRGGGVGSGGGSGGQQDARTVDESNERCRSALARNLCESLTEFSAPMVRVALYRMMSTQRINRNDDVYKMIRLAVEGIEVGGGGDDDGHIRNDGDRDEDDSRDLARLKRNYGLVPRAANAFSITLPRVCLSFPLLTCSYLPFARRTAVPYERMRRISADYPRPMMHAAFAYLIPDASQDYCALLAKAHMLHEYAFHLTASGVRHRDVPAIRDARVVAHIVAYTRAAVRRSHFDRETRAAFLFQHCLIHAHGDRLVVAPEVLTAAKTWDKEVKRILNASGR